MRTRTSALIAALGLALAAGCGDDGDGGDAGADAGSDTEASTDSHTDTGTDTGTEADADTGTDAGTDAEADAGTDTGTDAEAPTLIWQDPPSEGWYTWADAATFCEGLDLDGHDDWRVPSISELRTLLVGCPATETGGDCTVSDDCLGSGCGNDPCDGCEMLGGPGEGGCYWDAGLSGVCATWMHWSSSSWDGSPSDTFAWLVGFDRAHIVNHQKAESALVRCVRSE